MCLQLDDFSRVFLGKELLIINKHWGYGFMSQDSPINHKTLEGYKMKMLHNFTTLFCLSKKLQKLAFAPQLLFWIRGTFSKAEVGTPGAGGIA